MASISQSAQIQLAQIETQKQAALEKLDVKFASADAAKSSFGYIGIISVSLLYAVFLLNDLLKLTAFILKKYAAKKLVYNKISTVSESETKSSSHELEHNIDRLYSSQLEARLERVHLRLLRAKYVRREYAISQL